MHVSLILISIKNVRLTLFCAFNLIVNSKMCVKPFFVRLTLITGPPVQDLNLLNPNPRCKRPDHQYKTLTHLTRTRTLGASPPAPRPVV